jgi:flagellar biosynthesis anti-sigma factor FlgM
MKIYDRDVTGASSAEAARTQDTQRTSQEGSVRSGAPAASGGGGDHVEFSSTLGSLSRAMSSYGSSRTNRVAALAAQYQNGTYQVDSQATSQSMVAEALASSTS